MFMQSIVVLTHDSQHLSKFLVFFTHPIQFFHQSTSCLLINIQRHIERIY
ncbi:hypothetical protein Hanom_Chr12g01180861 [Helianthus anomalus]